MSDRKLVLSLSGGADSSVLLYMAADQGYSEIRTVTFDYGQRHKRELESMSSQLLNLARKYKDITITNKLLDVSFIKAISPTSSLTNLDIDNPHISNIAGDAQPASYVPYRNMMFLSICSAFAESQCIDTVWYGAAQVDSLAGYWDGSDIFVNSLNNLTALNRKHRITVQAPLLTMSKKEIVEEGVRLGVKFEDTWTCYSNHESGLADATTPSSSLRIKGFIDSQYIDPIEYIQQEQLNLVYKQHNCKPIPGVDYRFAVGS